jgi:hypothetical protein
LYYNARYYDPALDTFISPDPLIPDPARAFDDNRYLYARGNPLKYTDPTGHCPAPPEGLGATICLALFIEPATLKAGPLTVHGDGRGFSSASDPTASRGFIWIPVAAPEHYQAQMNPSGYYLLEVPLFLTVAPQGPVALVPAASGDTPRRR